MNERNDIGDLLLLGICIGAGISLAVVGLVNENRHKRQLHGRMNSITQTMQRLRSDFEQSVQRLAELRRWRDLAHPMLDRLVNERLGVETPEKRAQWTEPTATAARRAG